MANTATQKTSEYELNQLNLAMRQTPWFQEFFKQLGLDPNKVRLNDQQRAQLTALAAANGYQLGDRMKFDEAGNINQMGGYAGMPKWAKVAIAAAPVAGSMLIPGVREATFGQLGNIFTGGGTNAAVNGATFGSGAYEVPVVASGVTKGPSLLSQIGGALKNPRTIAGIGQAIGAAGQGQTANRNAQNNMRYELDQLGLQRDATKLAAEKSARDAQSDAMNKAVWGNYVANHKSSVPDSVAPYARVREVTEGEREAGRQLARQAQDLMNSGQYTKVTPQITPYEDYDTEAGLMERIGGYASPALTFYGLYDRLFGK